MPPHNAAASRRASVMLVLTMLFASLSPLTLAEPQSTESVTEVMSGGLSEFDPSIEGKRYLFTDEAEPVVSATGHLKIEWREAGYPGLVLPFSPGYLNSKSTIRACENAWSQGDTGNVSTASGSVSVTVQKISANSAILVENGQIISSTTLNDIASTWESTIYPTVTTYFGSPPDVDNNCQIEIVLIAIDGAGGTGGYFSPGISSVRESVFVDVDDMSWRNTILAHEFEHLLHNSRDPYEYLWIDEGAADMAAYLAFGVTSTLTGHANEWSQDSSLSVRWWNGRIADYGAGFMFLMYLADKLGGGAAIQRLVADTATGGAGIENLAQNPETGATYIGTTMSEIFANFSAAVALDSAQGAFGFTNLDLTSGCIAAYICKAQMSGYNDQWVNDWNSSSQNIEGWGMRAYKFAQGSGAPLNMMVQPTQFGFEGAIMARDAVTGTWSMSSLRIDSGTGAGTGLVHGFGNTTDEVWLLTWYESMVTDCDYNYVSCGITTGSYPTASLTVHAGLITDPAEVSIDTIDSFDRDEDGLDDSVRIDLEVESNAFFEILEVTVEAYVNNSVSDSVVFDITAGNSVPSPRSVWFTPPSSGDWTYGIRIRDVTGEIVDQAFSLPMTLANMDPIASGSMSTPVTQTWLPVIMFGSGYDSWGFSQLNGTFSHNDTPVAYIWDLGDNNSSGLKNPTHSYLNAGEYQIVLVVQDQGGHYSDPQSWNISVSDISDPIPEISVDGVIITDELMLLTDQRVQFSARGTSDNVPLNELVFTWDWGDGQSEGGRGAAEAGHSWVDGSADGIIYTLILTVDDGIHIVEHSIYIKVLNRLPKQIFDEPLQTYTLTPLTMPTVFEDSDGMIVEYSWFFEDGVNLDGSGMTLTSDFSSTDSILQNPSVGWLEPGMKNVTLEVTDDDGNTSMTLLQVQVLNQRPVAVFARPQDGDVDTAYTFVSESFDPDGDTSLLQTMWEISDFDDAVYNVSSVSHTFLEPGLYTISLTVIDDRGLSSATKSYSIRIANPLPVPELEFSCPSINGSVMSEIPQTEEGVIWQVPHTAGGGAFVAPGDPIRFDGSDSYDADPLFVGRTSTDSDSSEWNGIVSWIWDFGDASSPVSGPVVWHAYEIPGTYVVTLTVVDGFEGGETNTTTLTVHVSRAPVIITNDPISADYVAMGDIVLLNSSAEDADLVDGIEAWMDLDQSDDSDGDGNPANDRDRPLTGPLTVRWDLNALQDTNLDGDTRNDWLWGNQTWNQPGEIRILMQVCDGVDVCSSEEYVITVLSIQEDDKPKSLADLTWSDLVPNKESAGLLALVAAVLLLGWLIMREKDEDELDADEMLETYDVTEVEVEGGLPGMDQHKPPPQPKYLTVQERRNKESGYIRPIRTRRR
ncbi:MAG: hypothetical protein CND01_02975 [Marine Group II euryarchaeote MED-G34]|nr:MAG: hypothetical protein CND01_02975 [Marine Group II euryarchaeote MED-G34]